MPTTKILEPTEGSSCSTTGGHCCSGWGKKLIMIVLILGLVAVSIVSVVMVTKNNNNFEMVSFTGTGKVSAKPDIAQVSLAVRTPKVNTASEAVKQNSSQINAIIKALKDLGIAEKDIKTSNFSVNPVYNYKPNTPGEIIGYEVYQELLTKIRNLDNIGQVITRATELGANQIGNIAFTIDDKEALKKQARAEAVTQAKERAQEMAVLTGMHLKKIVNVYENNNDQPMGYGGGPVMMKDGATGMGGAPDIQVGENEIKVDVTIMYKVYR